MSLNKSFENEQVFTPHNQYSHVILSCQIYCRTGTNRDKHQERLRGFRRSLVKITFPVRQIDSSQSLFVTLIANLWHVYPQTKDIQHLLKISLLGKKKTSTKMTEISDGKKI